MFRTLDDGDFKGKRTLLRVDFNVPLDKHGNVVNDKRIREALPTIKYLLSKGARIILVTHVGRPEGKIVEELRTHGIAKRLSAILGRDVKKLNDVIGDHIKEEVAALQDGDVVVLENIRFYPEEKKNCPEFSKHLASFADIYVNDAFAVSHREEASLVGVTHHLPSYGGFIIEKELSVLRKAIENPQKPFVAIVGGSKADKISAIRNLLPHLSHLIIGGKLANTFLKAKGFDMGSSAYDESSLQEAEQVIALAGEKLVLPDDVVLADRFDKDANAIIVPTHQIPKGWMALDIGPRTIQKYKMLLDQSATILWAGPIGVFEFEKFSMGTKQIAFTLAASNATTIIGGGDSAAAVEKYNLTEHMSIVSTGGGASLQLLEGEVLPGVQALIENKQRFPSQRVDAGVYQSSNAPASEGKVSAELKIV